MGAYAWRDQRSVATALFEEGHRFSFLQAVRLLERLSTGQGQTAPGDGTDPAREVVQFRHAVRLDFPPTDVEMVRRSNDGPAEMVVNVLGLAGAHGPLPPHVSELIVERSFRKDTAFRDFLDIFNHRLVSLLYRARKKYRPVLDARSPDRGRVANVLNALLGLATPHLLNRMELPDRALLPYTGIIVDRHRSTVGLVRVIEDYFEVGARVESFRGRWHEIEPGHLTRIGASGTNQRLGRSALLAHRVWDQEAGIEICLGPLTLQQFLDFLPMGRSYAALIAAVRFYLRNELDFAFRLQLRGKEIPSLCIGRSTPGGAYLGWTSWLRKPMTRPRIHLGRTSWLRAGAGEPDDTQVCVRGRA